MKKINMILLARQLRQCYTEEEDILWQALRNRKLGGLKFRRQHPFGIYILDFYCAEKKFEIELDGAQHFTTEGQFYDNERERFLLNFEIRTIRFANHRIRNDLEKVLEEILFFANSSPLTPLQP